MVHEVSLCSLCFVITRCNGHQELIHWPCNRLGGKGVFCLYLTKDRTEKQRCWNDIVECQVFIIKMNSQIIVCNNRPTWKSSRTLSEWQQLCLCFVSVNLWRWGDMQLHRMQQKLCSTRWKIGGHITSACGRMWWYCYVLSFWYISGVGILNRLHTLSRKLTKWRCANQMQKYIIWKWKETVSLV